MAPTTTPRPILFARGNWMAAGARTYIIQADELTVSITATSFAVRAPNTAAKVLLSPAISPFLSRTSMSISLAVNIRVIEPTNIGFQKPMSTGATISGDQSGDDERNAART